MKFVGYQHEFRQIQTLTYCYPYTQCPGIPTSGAHLPACRSPFLRNAIHDVLTKVSPNSGNSHTRWLYQHILIWFCLWSKMVLPFASAVKIFENAFSKFPVSPFLMSVIVPRGWGIWSLIEDLQCQLGQFGVWANGPLQNLNILGNQSLFIPYIQYIYICTRFNPSPDIIHVIYQ